MTVNAHHNRDIVALWQLRNSPEEVNKIIQEGKTEGLSKSSELQALAHNGEYVPVLKAVWSERDRSRRLEWLRQHASLHAPLMCELALAEFVSLPTAKTVHHVSMPLIYAAKLRVLQDCQCSKDPSVYDGCHASSIMNFVYIESLKKLVQKHLQRPLFAIGLFEQDRTQIFEKELSTMQCSLSSQLPNPEWTRWHGARALSEDAMHPPGEWQQRRADFARREISKIETSLSQPALDADQALFSSDSLLKGTFEIVTQLKT